MTLITSLTKEIVSILNSLGTSMPNGYSYIKTVERAYEVKVLVTILKKFIANHGMSNIRSITPPIKNINLNGGAFDKEKCFRVELMNGEVYFFTTDVECLGISYYKGGNDKFEVDIVVVKDPNKMIKDYPLPGALYAVYECKFGKYKRSQLRELLGLKRHLNVLEDKNQIETKIIRPTKQNFLDPTTAIFFNISQDII